MIQLKSKDVDIELQSYPLVMNNHRKTIGQWWFSM